MYLQPRTVDEACAALAAAPYAILSGGTDFYPALGDRAAPEAVLDLSGLTQLAVIEVGPDEVRIGARVTWSQLLRAELPSAFDGLKAAAREVGSVQIQNVGTLAGNLCTASPAADGAPPLLALDAAVELASAAGTRRLPLADFLQGYRRTALAPGEMVTAIVVPCDARRSRAAFLKLGARRYLVISIVSVAAVLTLDGTRVAAARVAVGSCAETARRLPQLEAALIGAPARSGIGNVVTASHLAPLSPIDDVRASAGYRDDAAIALVGRALEACVEPLS